VLWKFILKRIFYGFLVMLGVVTVVFLLFNVLPGDPARMMLGQHATQEQIDAINKDLGRDKSLFTQYLMYLNDISPLSVHDDKDSDHYLYLSDRKYSYTRLFNISEEKVVVVKYPYLKRSYITKRKVSEILIDTMLETSVLAFASIVIASFFGILLGIVAAVKKNTLFDSSSIVLSVLGMSGPSFFIGLIIAMLFGYFWTREIPLPVLPFVLLIIFAGARMAWLYYRKKQSAKVLAEARWGILARSFFWAWLVWLCGWLINMAADVVPLIDWTVNIPGTGLSNEGSLFYIDDSGNEQLMLKNLILPAITLGIRPLAIVVQLTRSSLLDVLSQDYIRTATAKGLSFYTVIFKHALKNALNPVVTAISGWFAGLMAGAVFVEIIFNWKGLGFEVVHALEQQDLPVVMGGVLTVGLIFVVINIIVDIVYGILDPRVRVQ
jgi:peptide/nickel transport system permease protein